MGSRSITFGQAISVLHNVLTSFSKSQRSRQIKVSFFLGTKKKKEEVPLNVHTYTCACVYVYIVKIRNQILKKRHR